MRRSRWLAVLLALAALAAAGVAANLYLLGLTQDTGEPVGRLSPKAVFPTSRPAPGATAPQAPTTTGDDHQRHGDRQPDD